MMKINNNSDGVDLLDKEIDLINKQINARKEFIKAEEELTNASKAKFPALKKQFGENISEFVSEKNLVGIVFNVFDEKGLEKSHSSEENFLRMRKNGVLLESLQIFKHC